MGNSQLSAAKKAKNDEFYTRMTDIEHELVHYRDHFKGKVVLCNCDDPFESNFFKYFALNFNPPRAEEAHRHLLLGLPHRRRRVPAIPVRR